MHGINLLKHALQKEPKRVLDLGVGSGVHSRAFIGCGAQVSGVDVKESPITHDNYTHQQSPFECLEVVKGAEPFDMIWCCHVLEHLPNVQAFLVQIEPMLKEDGWLYIAVPCNTQARLHVGHLTIWTPALLIYNLVCAGWDCTDAEWYTSYQTIGLCMKKKRIEDMSWRTGMPNEEKDFNEYTPIDIRHEHGAWLENNWPWETPGRTLDPPMVTVGVYNTDLPPETQLAYGPNPELRVGYERPL